MITFKDLNLSKQLLRALDDIGFENPTPIQEKAYPIISTDLCITSKIWGKKGGL